MRFCLYYKIIKVGIIIEGEGMQKYAILKISGILLFTGLLAMIATTSKSYAQCRQQATVRDGIGLALALDNYAHDTGTYPTTQQGLQALIEQPTQQPVPEHWAGPYLKKNKVPSDPWGNPYVYRFPALDNSNEFEIMSLGPDTVKSQDDIIVFIGGPPKIKIVARVPKQYSHYVTQQRQDFAPAPNKRSEEKEDNVRVDATQASEQSDNKKEVPGLDLIHEAWKALEDNDIKRVETVTDQILKRYGDEARRMQASLKEYPWESMEKIRHYQPLNDVGTAYFILGEIYRRNNNLAAAKLAYQEVIDHYFYSQTTDNCLMWKPVEAAKEKMEAYIIKE